jgi:hypothetical protein
MRLGCSGCLGLIIVIALGALLLGAVVVGGVRMLAAPDLDAVSSTPEDGVAAQRKLLDLTRAKKRGATVTLTEGEVNALLARHLVQARGMRLTTPSARLIGDDRFVFNGQCPLRQLLEEMALGALAELLPERWQTRPMWVHIGARLRVDRTPHHQLRTDVDEFALGRQPLPVALVRLLVDPASVGVLRWPLPSYIEQISVERGRVIVRSASSR